MNIVIPMAGRGSRLAGHQGDLPKPLLQVAGQPMIAWALRSLADVMPARTIFVALAEHDRKYGVSDLLRTLSGSMVEVVLLPDTTEGQLCSVLAARDLIDSTEDLLVASADTYIQPHLRKAIADRDPDCAGIISVAHLPGDRWSFARTDETGRVIEVAEKRRISDFASTGLYYFARGHQFVTLADDIIARGERTRGEYYVIPVYQKMIERGLHIDVAVAQDVWDMGTPEALATFERHVAHL